MMRVFVLAGGVGERLQPYTEVLPKCMMPVFGKPAVRHVVDALVDQGFDTDLIHVCIQEKDLRHFSHEFRDSPVIIKVSETPLGTAGEVYALGSRVVGPFMVIYSDDLTFRDYRKLVEDHLLSTTKEDVIATLAMTDNYRIPMGTMALQPETNRIFGFSEKPAGILPMWTGVAIFHPDTLGYMQLFKDFAKDIIPDMIADKKVVRGYMTHKPWVTLNDIQQWRAANRDLERL